MRFFRWFLSVSLLLSVSALRAATPDELYLDAFRLIQQADNLSSRGQKAVARERYQEARENLEKLQKSYPSYNKTAVQYRLNYVNQQAAALPKPAEPAPAERTAAPAAATPEARVAELQSENQMLQAKLQYSL